jgi:osmotically-inducible protein OsmY
MKSNETLRRAAAIALGVAVAVGGLAACDRTTSGSDATNTARNVRDRDERTATPTDQGESAGDRAITQNVRKAVVDNDQLSTNAHNVKIVTQDGVVTLRGPVDSAQEKATIVAMANKAPGVKRVDDQLEVVHATN